METLNRLDKLNEEVTDALKFLDQLENKTSAAAREVYAKISRVEEEIATLTSPSDFEGAIARRGAVRAAMNAGNKDRATELATDYIKAGVSDILAQELQALLSP